jgi:hypothetical protein
MTELKHDIGEFIKQGICKDCSLKYKGADKGFNGKYYVTCKKGVRDHLKNECDIYTKNK